MALPLSHLPKEIIREVKTRKWLAFLVFAGVSFAVLAAGFLWPYKYSSQVVIYVDDQNIIGTLMEGSAVTTKISEQASTARETLWGRSVLEQIAKDPDIYGAGAESAAPAQIEGRIGSLRDNTTVEARGENYFSIGYRATSPMEAFRTAQRLGQVFIEETNRRKKVESRGAYDFIDKQVKSYEEQLANVEARLQIFLSENVDGTEAEANSRMANLRSQLELAELEKAELTTRMNSLENQLTGVDQTIRQGRTVDIYQERIRAMESQLDELRLRYLDTYPDIVILREQIAELRKQRDQAIASGQPTQDSSLMSESTINPLYQELGGVLSTTRADMESLETRIRSLKGLIAQQESRMERIQANKTEYSELTRDMEVNKQIYDDLLKRRERARVSMHLDIEGQGLNFRINETAQYPLVPEGPKFLMFAIAGLFLGMAAPFGAVAGLLQVDPRVRAREQLEEHTEFPVLIEIPNVRTPFEKRRDSRATFAVKVCSLIVVVVYVAIAVTSELGIF
ncbi:XrtA system polysaccharide chain length determinant [Marinobacter changyiensis]|uniref:XrtA system polysaccharide chain length determinant n=1 Tax=Marinobacter changyiensis TaxID=2604091 RepID=UPI0012646FAB|nr:XrtA system polysaccharide chain length determinant [Marinobacter changyiensis]